MAKSSKEAHGAEGKTNLLLFDPESLVLVTDEAHPLYDERVHNSIDDVDVEDVMLRGIIEPVVVRKNPETGDTEVAAGRQRVKWAREANRRLKKAGQEPILVPAVVRRGSDEAMFDVMISENEHRDADTPLVRAAKMARAKDRGRSDQQIAVMFRVSTATVKNSLAVLDASAPVRKALDNGQITATEAARLGKIEDVAEQKAKLEEIVQRAPKVAGKKRGKGAAAAGEVLSGRKAMRSRKAVEEMLCVRLPAPARSALQWVLGEAENIVWAEDEFETVEPVSAVAGG